jgi:RNA polymerase sigma-70 factor (ECF subfamily)
MDPKALIERYCSSGDQASFRAFYQHEAPRLWRFLMARGSTRDEAYDLLSESFLRFVTVVCRDPAYPRALLYRIALNARIDLTRRDRVRGETVDPEALADLPAAGADPVEALAIRQAMARLHADEQNLLLMRYWIGLTHAEVAAALGLAEGTVRRQAAAALQKLRSLLEEGVIDAGR